MSKNELYTTRWYGFHSWPADKLHRPELSDYTEVARAENTISFLGNRMVYGVLPLTESTGGPPPCGRIPFEIPRATKNNLRELISLMAMASDHRARVEANGVTRMRN